MTWWWWWSSVNCHLMVCNALYAVSVICSQCKFSTEDITYAAGQSLRVIVKPRDTAWTSFYSSLCAQQSEAFHLVDLGQLLQSHRLWKENLPHIRPYYGEDCAACLNACSFHVVYMAVVMLCISRSTVDCNCTTLQHLITKVFIRSKIVLYLTKTFVVKTLYNYNLLCYMYPLPLKSHI